MSSGAALRGASPAHIYSAAKGGILSLTRALAGTYAKDNVRVNAICAGRILTERILARYGTPDAPKPAEDQQADARVKDYPFWVGAPEDIANIALFLASEESRMITGAAIPADGGRSAYDAASGRQARTMRAVAPPSAATDASRACAGTPTAGQGTRARPRPAPWRATASARRHAATFGRSERMPKSPMRSNASK